MNSKVDTKKYSPNFYEELDQQSFRSARLILATVFEMFDIRSVVDFGCGAGSWLRAAGELGAERLTGIDGYWVDGCRFEGTPISFYPHNLEEEIRVPDGVGYDLAMSLEVAEHLTPQRARSFVRDICVAAPVVVFSAAIPGQGGTNHINEQWPSYWAAYFAEAGYFPVDIIRPKIYRMNGINSWYKNNVILFLEKELFEKFMRGSEKADRSEFGCLDIVIPDIYENPSLRQSLKIARQVPRRLLHAIGRRLKLFFW